MCEIFVVIPFELKKMKATSIIAILEQKYD